MVGIENRERGRLYSSKISFKAMNMFFLEFYTHLLGIIGICPSGPSLAGVPDVSLSQPLTPNTNYECRSLIRSINESFPGQFLFFLYWTKLLYTFKL